MVFQRSGGAELSSVHKVDVRRVTEKENLIVVPMDSGVADPSMGEKLTPGVAGSTGEGKFVKNRFLRCSSLL